MKTRTRVVAWLYILAEILGIVILTVLAVVYGGVGTGLLDVHDPSVGFMVRVVFLGMSGACFLWIGVIILTLLPWIYLLKKREWAWWMLTIVFGLASGIAIAPLLHFTDLHSYGSQVVFSLIGVICFLPTLLILITDHPSLWKGRRKPAGSRRKRRTRRSYSTRRYRYY